MMAVPVHADDVSTVQQAQQRVTQDSYHDLSKGKYYTPGEDLVLFHLDGLKISLKGDQSAADFAHGEILAVEVVNELDVALDICFGIDFATNEIQLPVEFRDGDENYAPADLCVVPAASTAEGMIWCASSEPIRSLGDLQEAKFYFRIYDENRFEEPVELGPVTVQFPEEEKEAAEEAATESESDTSETPAVPESLVKLYGGIPDTVEELAEGVKAFLDMEQLPLLYEQCNPPEIYAELREKGSCTIGVSGEDWYGATMHFDENGSPQFADLTFDSSDEQSTVITCEEPFTYEQGTYPSVDFGYRLDMNGFIDIDVGEQLNYEDKSYFIESIVSMSHGGEEVVDGYGDCIVRYVTGKDTHYEVNLTMTSGMDVQKTWIGVYDEDGKLDYIDYIM